MTLPSIASADVDPRWADAIDALSLFVVDPVGLAGIALRARHGPVRDQWLSCFHACMPEHIPVRKLPPGIADDRLLGGLDLTGTLSAGAKRLQRGVLSEVDGGILVIPMAERLPATIAGRIAAVLDLHKVTLERDGFAEVLPAACGVLALDEGADDDEGIPALISSRLAFEISLEGVHGIALPATVPSPSSIAQARAFLASVGPAPAEAISALVKVATECGVEGVVVPLLALRAARASAALAGRSTMTSEDLARAMRLVIGPRARSAPPPPEPEQESQDDQPQDDPEPQTEDADSAAAEMTDVLREAVRAVLPEGLLSLKPEGARASSAKALSGAGARVEAVARGRPKGSSAGRMKPGARIALVDTLRAAAPWQALRASRRTSRARIVVQRDDLRFRRFTHQRESTVVFCVDASGSSAFQRLAEAKGAVELLLAEAYVSRTYASLIVFRSEKADVLLPPSRSLARAKALLKVLPGGGGTPLASGLQLGLRIALGERGKGRTPTIVVLTDGQANIAADGKPSRTKAHEDAIAAARMLAAQEIRAVFIDTSPRPREQGAELSRAMRANYVALPYARAQTVRDAVLAAVS